MDADFHWPITAREGELRAIETALGRGGGALLVGGPGVGKSLLFSTALEQAADTGGTVLSVGGASWRSGTRAQGFGSLAKCLEAVETSTPEITSSDRTLVGIDDAHLVDPATSDRLYRLVAAGRLSVLATVRQDVHAPAGIDKLWIERLIDRVEVTPFDSTELGEVLRTRLGGHTETATLERLWAATHGRALILRELVEHALEDGSLRCVDGTWTWEGLTDRLGKRLSDIIRVGLGGLSPDEHELVNMLAVAEPLEAEIVAESGLVHAAESLELRGIVGVEGTRACVHLRLAVPLSRVVVASGMSYLTAQRLRRQVADALERSGARGEDDLLRIVSLRIEAGLVPEREKLLAAARIAVRRTDFVLAERLCLLALRATLLGVDRALREPVPDRAQYAAELCRAVKHESQDPDHATDCVRTALLLGQVLVGNGCYEEAEAVLATALGSGVEVSHSEYIAAAHARLVNMACNLRRVSEADAELARAVSAAEPDRAAVLQASRAVIAAFSDRLEEAVAIGDQVLRADTAVLPVTEVLLPVVALAHTELGDPAGALDLLSRYRHDVRNWDTDAAILFNSVSARCSTLMGDLRGAAEGWDAIHRLDRTGCRPAFVQGVLVRARLLRLMGQPELAVALLRRTIVVGPSDGRHADRTRLLAQLAAALAESGRCPESLRTLVEVRASLSHTMPSPIAEDGVAYERALVLAHTGDRSGAVARALELADRATAAGRTLTAIDGLHLAVRIIDAGAFRFRERAQLLAEKATGSLTLVMADHIRALAEADGPSLSMVSAQFRSMGALPLSAEAAAQAARAYRASGRRRKSREAWATCRELLRAFQGTLPPWLECENRRHSDLAVARLTPREREVAALAATGLPNRDIADQLVVSVRTVENHLHRIYHKLGITTRNALRRELE